jgi:hypothetical protein
MMVRIHGVLYDQALSPLIFETVFACNFLPVHSDWSA